MAAGERKEPGEARDRARRRVCALFDACREAGTVRGTRAAALVSVVFGARLAPGRAVRLPATAYDPATGVLRPGPGPRRGASRASAGAREVLGAWMRIRGRGEGSLICRIDGGGEAVPGRPLDAGSADRILRWWGLRRAGLRELDVPALRRHYRSPWWSPAPDPGDP